MQRKNFLIKKNSKIKSINTNNYIINTFNLYEKNYIKKNKKHSKLIENLIEDNKNLNDKVNLLQEENSKLKQKIKNYKDNQEQLIMLVKIIQKSGVDVESLIDKWNNEVEEEEENEEKNEEITSKSLVLDSLNELNEKIDCSSFIPITMKDKKTENKLKVTGVPKLNFDVIKNKQQEKRNIKGKKNKAKNREIENYLNKSK